MKRRDELRTELRRIRKHNRDEKDVNKQLPEPRPERKPDYRTTCTISVCGQVPVNKFKDGSGQLHHHDPNVHVDTFECSNKHQFTVVYSEPCWCGWKQELPSESDKAPAQDADKH